MSVRYGLLLSIDELDALGRCGRDRSTVGRSYDRGCYPSSRMESSNREVKAAKDESGDRAAIVVCQLDCLRIRLLVTNRCIGTCRPQQGRDRAFQPLTFSEKAMCLIR
jgi:hypothetical protein